jgi:hypothetical protein
MALTDGLTNYWKLDETTGNAIDSVGGNDLVNTNTTYGAGVINNGAIFNGSSSRLISTNNVTVQASYSISIWLKINDGTRVDMFLQCRVSNGATCVNIVMAGDYAVHLSNFIAEIIATNKLLVGVWSHYVVTSDGSNNSKIYRNGVLDKTGVVAHSQTIAKLILGRREDSVSWYMSGMIDEVGLWSRELTADEVNLLFRGGLGNQYAFTNTLGSLTGIQSITG